MEERVFMDKLKQPDERALKDALGDCVELYTRLNAIASNYKKEWTFTKNSGWMQKFFDSKKALFYFIPLKNQFKISMAIRENEREMFLEEIAFKIYHERLQSAKKYIEGFAVQFFVTDSHDFEHLELLVKRLIQTRANSNLG